MLGRGAIALLLAGLTTGADAQSPPRALSQAAKAMVGVWEISTPSRARRCAARFGVEPAAAGFRIEFEPRCIAAFASFGAVVAWTLTGEHVVQFVDVAGKSVVEFTEVESGIYESDRRGEGLLFLQPQAALRPDAHTAEQLFGDWQLLRELDKPLCRITLSKAAAGAGSYRLVVKPGCDAVIAGAGLTAWRLDQDQLVLSGPSAVWRFAESDSAIWERVPLRADPLLLMRP